jgi:hypothetical protein
MNFRFFRFRLFNRLRHFHIGMALRFKALEEQVLERKIPELIVGSGVQQFPNQNVEVHMLLGKRTWLMALWAAKSFQWATGHCWHFVFQDDGTLEEAQIHELGRLFPSGVVKGKLQADAEMEKRLVGHPACLAARRRHIMFLKLFDPYFYSSIGDRYILLDSDVLFFRKPDEILQWAASACPGFLFDPDVKDSYSIPTMELEDCFQVSMLRRANAGLAMIPRAGVDLDVVEEYLRGFEKESTHDLWLEQTAYALLASKWRGEAALLPESYEMSFVPARRDGCVARHYVGTNDSRPHFFREGVVELAKHLL